MEYHARRIIVRKGVWNEVDLQLRSADLQIESRATSDFRKKAAAAVLSVDSLIFFLAGATIFEVAIVSSQ